MRSIPFILAAFVASGPAAAQSWEEYSYPDYAFSVVFPANPQVETTTYQVATAQSPRGSIRSGKTTACSRSRSPTLPILVSTKGRSSIMRSRRFRRVARWYSTSHTASTGSTADSSLCRGRTAAVQRSRCSTIMGGSTSSRLRRSPAQATGQPIRCASSNRWSLLMAARTARRIRSAPFAKAVAPMLSTARAIPSTPRALTIRGAK
jgi:hypothetical protein